MPTHVHLLVSEPRRCVLAHALHGLKLSVAKTLVPRPFWQVRYHDFNLYTRDKVVEKLKYMHRNPVKGGLVEGPEEWRWSSSRDYLLEERGLVDRGSGVDVSPRGPSGTHLPHRARWRWGTRCIPESPAHVLRTLYSGVDLSKGAVLRLYRLTSNSLQAMIAIRRNPL